MTEHLRQNGFQWCDRKMYMIVDQYKGPERVAAGSLAQGYLLTRDQALAVVVTRPGWESRLFIVEVNAITAFKIENDMPAHRTKMKTLDEHNRDEEQKSELIRKAMNKAGVACPKCGTEMRYYGETVLPSNPTKRRVDCPNCQHSGYKLI